MKFERQKAGKTTLAVMALLALVLTGTEAWATGGRGGGRSAGGSGKSGGFHHHRHHHGSRYSHSSGSVFYGSYWAFPAFWYAQAAPYYLPTEPVYYIERSEEELRSTSMWYYCESEAAYYPYVSNCPAGWLQVEPFALP
jgi:hypothetical protein